jgi:hypothetical protein
MKNPRTAVADLPRVAAIATMASRIETFQQVLPTIRAQVEHLYVYLDGYSSVPNFLKGLDHVSVHRAEEVGDLHASSRFLCLQELITPTVVAIVDDDIMYPPDYIDRLVDQLQQVDGQALVGVHGRLFTPPHRSYVKDALTLNFSAPIPRSTQVHELGTGTCAFISSLLDVDPRKFDRFDMDDIVIAIEAQRRSLPRIAIARVARWLKPYALWQSDSLWTKTKIDDTEQSRRMRTLLSLYA